MQKRKRPEFHDRGAVWSNFRTTGVDGSDIESKARAQQAEKVPPWIKPNQPNEQESPTPNSLVLWQPPPWAAEPAQAVDRTQESDMMAIEP